MTGVQTCALPILLSGVIENLIKSFESDGDDLLIHLGPAISMSSFEVGDEVKNLYLSKNINFQHSFTFDKNKNYLDLYKAARVILENFQIKSIFFLSKGWNQLRKNGSSHLDEMKLLLFWFFFAF